MTKIANSITNISPQEFNRLIDKPLLIDVRSRIEYLSAHVPEAINLSLPRLLMGKMPWFRWLLPSWFQELSKSQAIAVICLTAHRSPIAANVLVKIGFKICIAFPVLKTKRLTLRDIRQDPSRFFFGNEPPDFPATEYVKRGDPAQVGVTVRFTM